MVFFIHIGWNIVKSLSVHSFLVFAVLALKFLQLDDIKRLEFKAHNISSNNHIKATVYILQKPCYEREWCILPHHALLLTGSDKSSTDEIITQKAFVLS